MPSRRSQPSIPSRFPTSVRDAALRALLTPLRFATAGSVEDGKSTLIGRLLRERYGYRGELRAVGDVQRDQLYYLYQVGFDAFALPEAADVLSALRGLADFSDGYQLTQARTPWFRRRAEVQP